ncbi:MAG: cytochrome d ubiquinol oxidase subunit II [Propionibacteriaceae bacterium]
MLQTVWFILVVVLWVGYFFLEGFDYGVAMLLKILGKNDKERRVLLTTVGPFWDGNEVWLLTAGGATFAAFPGWYATLFSALYLPLLLVLVGLILRGLAFEYRGKREGESWRNGWDWAATIGSFLPSLVFGVGLANWIIGLPVDAKQLYAGSFWSLFSPYGLLGGVMLVAVFLAHGALFLTLRTKDDLRERSGKLARTLAFVAAGLLAIFAIWGNAAYSMSSAPALSWALMLLAAVGMAVAGVLAGKKEMWSFIAGGLSIVFLIVGVFSTMYPNLGFDNSLAQGHPLNVHTAASTPMTLKIMTIAAVVFVPIVLAYQTWTYIVFRRRIGVANIPDNHGTSNDIEELTV